ncbi:hypothetical protein ACU686_20445 [Yinghuangia aomiensis]
MLKKYDKVIVPEMNLGQLALLLRAKYLVDAIAYNQVRGLPFKAEELAHVIQEVIESVRGHPSRPGPTAAAVASRRSRSCPRPTRSSP